MKYLNGYQQRDNIVLVYRDDAGQVQEDIFPGEQVAFFKSNEITPQMRLNKRVQSWTTDNAGWTRAVFKSGFWDPDAYNKWTKQHGLWTPYREQTCKAWDVQSYEGDVSALKRLWAESDFGIARPKRCYFDIETDSRVKIDIARDGAARVLVWSVVSETGEAWSGCLEEDTDAAEAALLNEMWGRLAEFDQVCAWFGDGFDFPVIKARSKLHDIKPLVIKRILFIDQLACFKRNNIMSADSGEEKTSFKLDDIAVQILGFGKHDVDASKAYEMWVEDRAKLVKYCVQDTDLLRLIENETGYLELFQTVAEVTGVFADSRGLKPTAQVDSYMLRLGHREGVHFKTKWYEEDIPRVKFEGAYVMEPATHGITKDVHIADFASLYPSIMITWNISPEMKDSEGTCISPGNNCRTATEREGIICKALRELLELRAKWKKMKAAAAPGSAEEKDAERRTNAYKTAANSFYGVVGTPYSRFFDRELSEATTTNGKWLILQTNAAATERGWRVVYADTDSTFVIGPSEAEFQEFIDWCNKELYPPQLKEFGCRTNTIKLASDKYLEHIVFTSAKRYVAKQKDNDKPILRGLEYKRGDTNRIARLMQKVIIDKIVASDFDPKSYESVVMQYREMTATEPLSRELVVMSKSVKDIDNYKVDTPQVRVAKILRERGEDVREGTRISYVIVDGYSSPMKVIPAEDYQGEEVDRDALWNFAIFPASMRLLEAAFPNYGWDRWQRNGKPKNRALPGQLSLF